MKGVIAAHDRNPIDTNSQHGEVTVALDLLAPDDPKFVVDVGAHDGLFLSNSYSLLMMGWSGILVEPLSSAFSSLSTLYKDNPNVTCVQRACGDKPGVAKLYFGSDEPGQMSTISGDPVFTVGRSGEFEKVEVVTLSSVLAEGNAPRDISLLSVDAEGIDYEVFCGLDFTAFRPRIVITEEYAQNPIKHMEKYALLNERGYTLYGQYGCNTIWVLPEYLPQRA